MRAKRSKVYKKAMALYTSAFKFREPFQVLIDSEFAQRAASQKLDLPARLADILGGQVKIMITQCCMQRLYNAGAAAQTATDLAKTCERRKCNHWQLKETDAECISGIMGDTNRFNYCVATQSPALRKQLRKVPGVPILFEKRSIILLEPPSDASVGKRAEIEESKLHVPSAELASLNPSTSASGLAPTAEASEGNAAVSGVDAAAALPAATRSTASTAPNTVDALMSKKRKRQGPKQPNPLSIKKSKKPAAAKSKSGDKGKGKAKDGADKENERPAGQLSNKKRKADGDAPDAASKKAKTDAKGDGQKKPADPTKGVSRAEGPGTSKKALRRKAKKAAAKADGPSSESAAVKAD